MNRIIKINTQPNENEILSTMGCRTMTSSDVNFNEEYFKKVIDYVLENDELPDNLLKSAAQKDGRGNICPVTIIMPTLAMQCKDDKNPVGAFMKLLDKKIHEAKDMLIERFDYICSQSPESARFMYENNTMAGYIPEEGIRSALRHGTLALGNLGLAETLQLLIGKDHTTEEGMALAKEIYALFAKRCK